MDSETATIGAPMPLGTAPGLADIVGFLRGVGLAVEAMSLPDTTLMPAMTVRDGALLYDPDKPGWLGDLLHEAGHLAVIDGALRATLPEVLADPGEEMASIAWSYAAAVAIGLPIESLFHATGYRGGAESLIAAFAKPGGPGIPLLQYWGMTPRADENGPRFPAMRLWLRPASGDQPSLANANAA